MIEMANWLIVVLSNGTGWGCISEYGEDSMKECMNKTMSTNMTALSNMHTCR